MDRGDPALHDLKHAPGSAALAPVAPFTFIEEDKSGTQPKFKVRDAAGTLWQVKVGPEVQSETASTRLVWAAGYFTDEAYLVPWAKIADMPKLSRSSDDVFIGGVVTNARFEPRREGHEPMGEWEWEENPFVGSRELDGLKVLMMLLNNWDARDSNNRMVRVSTPGTAPEVRYMVADLGATLGRAGGTWEHSKNDVQHFVKSKFVEGAASGIVKFHYRVRPKGLGMFAILHPNYLPRVMDIEQSMGGVKVEHARWIGARLDRLTDQQLRDALGAAGYDEPTTEAYVAALRQRFQQLTSLPAGE